VLGGSGGGEDGGAGEDSGLGHTTITSDVFEDIGWWGSWAEGEGAKDLHVEDSASCVILIASRAYVFSI
jgi:hypothetical protein